MNTHTFISIVADDTSLNTADSNVMVVNVENVSLCQPYPSPTPGKIRRKLALDSSFLNRTHTIANTGANTQTNTSNSR